MYANHIKMFNGLREIENDFLLFNSAAVSFQQHLLRSGTVFGPTVFLSFWFHYYVEIYYNRIMCLFRFTVDVNTSSENDLRQARNSVQHSRIFRKQIGVHHRRHRVSRQANCQQIDPVMSSNQTHISVGAGQKRKERARETGRYIQHAGTYVILNVATYVQYVQYDIQYDVQCDNIH